MGFDVADSDVHPCLKDHQRDIVRWAIAGGRRAIFAAFGLGKSVMQLELMRLIGQKEGGRQLIIAPLGVRQEFKRDSSLVGIHLTFVRRSEEAIWDGCYITNYESVRDGRLDVNLFNAVTLDEAAVLRSFGSKTYQTFLTLFGQVKYRFVATATPSPNRYKELIHYAGFLGIMDTGQALTRFFQRDSTKANNLTLYPHMEKAFWLWMHSWSIFLQRPSDLGYSDAGYILPELHIYYHEINSGVVFRKEKSGQLNLVSSASLDLSSAAAEKKRSMLQRVEKMSEIVAANHGESFLLWHDQEEERHAIKKVLPAAVEVYGTQDLDAREQSVIDFSDGKIQYLATKPILSGSGCNFQRYCHNAIYLGIGFKFNDFIQSIHRIFRFMQEHECHIHIIYTDKEIQILRVLQEKWEQHKKMVAEMSELIKKHGLSVVNMAQELARSIGCKRIEVGGNKFTAVNNDCVAETMTMPDNSVDLIHTSIPFANHYEYSPSYNDFGHTTGNGHFWEQMDFLTPELLRVLRPGRVAAIHVKDRILFGNVTGDGMPTCDSFHEETSFHFQKHGFRKIGMITIVTDVVRENNQTYRLGWTEQCKDGSKMGVGCPEYIMLFRKVPTDTCNAYADVPVVKNKTEYSRARWQTDAHAFWRSSGDRMLSVDEIVNYPVADIKKLFTTAMLAQVYDYESHVKIGEALDLRGVLPSSFMLLDPGSWHADVWHDINRMRTLNGDQQRKGLQAHVCPLQFDIVRRIIERYSNIDEVVFDPFAGLMTVPMVAMQLRRRGIGIELNHGYFFDGVKYLEGEERKISMPSLFDFEKIVANNG